MKMQFADGIGALPSHLQYTAILFWYMLVRPATTHETTLSAHVTLCGVRSARPNWQQAAMLFP